MTLTRPTDQSTACPSTRLSRATLSTQPGNSTGENDIGSITIGKKADLVVLSENPYDVDPFDLERIRVIETFLDGRRNNLSKLKDIRKTDIQFLYRCTDA